MKISLRVLSLKQKSSHQYDCRKEPQKLQEEGPEEEGVSSRYSILSSPTASLAKAVVVGKGAIFVYNEDEKNRKTYLLIIAPTLSLRRNGTMCTSPPFSTSVPPQSPPATELLVRVSIESFNRLLEIAADSLKGRVFEVSLADLNRDSNEQAWRKMKVQIEEVKGFDCYTNFYGMDITRDKLCTIVKKWHTTIEAFVQTKTLDGYLLRMFCIGFTRRTQRQVSATCYAKGSQRKLIRKKMMEIMINEAQKSTLKELTKKL